MAIFFNFKTTSNHLHPLQVENCDSNSRLVVDKDDNVKSGLKGLNYFAIQVTIIEQSRLSTTNDRPGPMITQVLHNFSETNYSLI